MRLCGSFAWKHAARLPHSWPIPRLLGAGAIEWSPPGSERTRVGLWSPAAEALTHRYVAGVAGVAVVFAGYLQDVPAAYASEAAYVLDRYRAGDADWIRSANGVFGFAILDEDADCCVFGVDRLGIRPLYYSHDADGVCFSGTLAAAIPWGRRRPELDYDTLQELMVLGFPLTNRTFLQGIERIPPGTLVEVRKTGQRRHRYWSLDRLPDTRAQAIASFLDQSQERLRRALSRLLARVPAPTLCLLSSGFDSRRLLLEASAVGGHLAAVTSVWPYPARAGFTIEPAVTTELCRRLGVPHRVVVAPRSGGTVAPRPARFVRDVLLDFQVYGRDHIWAVPLVAALRASDPHVNLDGICGDTFFNNAFYLLPRSVWGRSQPDREVLDAIAPDRERADREWRGLISCSLSSRLEAALTALPAGPSRLSFFYLLGRTRATVALLPYGILDERVESVCPYLDNDVMEHALTLDPITKSDARLQALALRRHFPSFSDIPSSHSPATDVPPAYLTPLRHTDPNFSGRFTVSEVADLLLQTRTAAYVPPPDPKDLAFAALSTVGLAGLGPSWREPHVRDTVQARRAIALFRSNDVGRVARVRAQAATWLARWAAAAVVGTRA
jgi:asparagine synthetase B (glutamine-hydrolysing)